MFINDLKAASIDTFKNPFCYIDDSSRRKDTNKSLKIHQVFSDDAPGGLGSSEPPKQQNLNLPPVVNKTLSDEAKSLYLALKESVKKQLQIDQSLAIKIFIKTGSIYKGFGITDFNVILSDLLGRVVQHANEDTDIDSTLREDVISTCTIASNIKSIPIVILVPIIPAANGNASELNQLMKNFVSTFVDHVKGSSNEVTTRKNLETSKEELVNGYRNAQFPTFRSLFLDFSTRFNDQCQEQVGNLLVDDNGYIEGFLMKEFKDLSRNLGKLFYF